MPELVIDQEVVARVIVPAVGAKLAPGPRLNAPSIVKLEEVDTVAELAMVKLLKVKVPELAMLEPLFKVIVPEGLKLAELFTVSAPAMVAEPVKVGLFEIVRPPLKVWVPLPAV